MPWSDVNRSLNIGVKMVKEILSFQLSYAPNMYEESQIHAMEMSFVRDACGGQDGM